MNETKANAKALLSLDLAIAMLETIARGGTYGESEYVRNVASIKATREALRFSLRVTSGTMNARGRDNQRTSERKAAKRREAAEHRNAAKLSNIVQSMASKQREEAARLLAIVERAQATVQHGY